MRLIMKLYKLIFQTKNEDLTWLISYSQPRIFLSKILNTYLNIKDIRLINVSIEILPEYKFNCGNGHYYKCVRFSDIEKINARVTERFKAFMNGQTRPLFNEEVEDYCYSHDFLNFLTPISQRFWD